jgi:non-ribosomal peptide synthetase component F
MVLVAALSVLLYLQTGQQDIRIGTLAANRSGRDSQGLIGHFVNTVILRTVLSPDMTWKQLLMHVRQVTLAAYANQKLPFERLARVLEEERKIERSSLFQILLSYQNSTFQAQKLTGLTFASLGGQLPTLDSKVTLTAYDLILNLREASTKFTGSVNYKTDAFDNGVVVSMVERFATILKHMVADTGERYSLIPDTLRA